MKKINSLRALIVLSFFLSTPSMAVRLSFTPPPSFEYVSFRIISKIADSQTNNVTVLDCEKCPIKLSLTASSEVISKNKKTISPFDLQEGVLYRAAGILYDGESKKIFSVKLR